MKNNKLSIILFSNDFDKAFSALTLATGSAAINWEVNLFFAFWGINLIKNKQQRAFLGNNFLNKILNFILGGINNLPLSKLNFWGLSKPLMKHLMKKNNIADINILLNSAIQMNINFYVCSASFLLFGLKKNDLLPEVKEIVGVAQFLEKAQDGHILFI